MWNILMQVHVQDLELPQPTPSVAAAVVPVPVVPEAVVNSTIA